ncbi:MAG: hypothetical protein PHQ65_15175 [Bacteroidales bacterium]|nr:hypothetical protein [Bacteroidales bacterium]
MSTKKEAVEEAVNPGMKSEHTGDMKAEEITALQEKVKNMSPEELKEFRNQMDPDAMGFQGEEGEDNE